MSPETHGAFDRIVLEGLYLPAGMPRWDDALSKADTDAIHAYPIALQTSVRERELKLQRAGKPLDERALMVLSNF